MNELAGTFMGKKISPSASEPHFPAPKSSCHKTARYSSMLLRCLYRHQSQLEMFGRLASPKGA
jgi:hypothetical protein